MGGKVPAREVGMCHRFCGEIFGAKYLCLGRGSKMKLGQRKSKRLLSSCAGTKKKVGCWLAQPAVHVSPASALSEKRGDSRKRKGKIGGWLGKDRLEMGRKFFKMLPGAWDREGERKH